MVTDAEHLAQFQHNVSVAEQLAASGNYGWAVTVLFYAGLHILQAYLVRSGALVESHVQRERQMLRSELLPILDPYTTLRNDSEEARYECRRFSREEFESIRNGSFTSVTTHLRSLLGVS